MRKSRTIIVFCIAFLFAVLVGMSQATAGSDAVFKVNNRDIPPELSDRITEFINQGMETWHSPGFALGIVKNGSLAWSGYFGYANIEQKKPVTESTVFRIGSISKTFTAVAMMQLWEKNKFRMEDSVQDYAPYRLYLQKNDACRPVTFMDIFTHTSGGGEFKSIKQMFNIINPPLFVLKGRERKSLYELYESGIVADICPGTKWAYCNYCIGSLGLMLENISGQSFKEYTDENLFKPLNMNSSSFYEVDAILANAATGYNYKKRKDYKPGNLVRIDTVPAGNIYSTVDDMANYMIMLLDRGTFRGNRILKPETIEYMWTPHYLVDKRLTMMGIVFIIDEDYFGHRAVWHNGGMPGFTAQMILFPDDDIGLIALNSSMTDAPEQIAAGIIKMLFGYKPPDETPPLDEDIMSRLTGKYVSPEPDFLTDARFLLFTLGAQKVKIKNGELMLSSNIPGKVNKLVRVEPEDPWLYEMIMEDNEIPQHIIFRPGPDGRAQSMLIGMNEYVRAGGQDGK